jgi:hypothetical protein
MSDNSWISFAAGVVAGVVVWALTGFTNPYLGYLAFTLVAGGTALALGPDTPDNGKLRPDEMQFNQSAEDATIPVIFGTSRVAANYVFVDVDAMVTTKIKEDTGGGGSGGGSSETTGFKYRVPIDFAFSMGEIDELVRVFGSPGLDVGFEDPDGGLVFAGGAPEEIIIRWVAGERSQDISRINHFEIQVEDGDFPNEEGGECTFYPGSPTQGSDLTTDDKNHRHVCFASFPAYRMTNTTAPRSMLAEIRRMPKVLDDDDVTIPNFNTRASNNTEDPEYNDANPAAIAFEIQRNPIWGKGRPASEINVQDFRLAASWYAVNRIGISTAMGNQTANEFINRLREIFGLWIWWDGEQIRCLCVYDSTQAYENRVRLSAGEIIGTPSVARPSLATTNNEIRLQFTNREENWQRTVASFQDLAHAQTVGGMRSNAVDGAEIGTRRTAELLAYAMLRQMAYPGAACTLQVQRSHSGLQPGSFVELLWDEWREAGLATSYWRVVDINDDEQSAEGIEVSMIEDMYASAIDGEVGLDDFVAPTSAIEGDQPLSNEDLNEGKIIQDRDPGDIEPVYLGEPNAWITGMQRRIVVGPTKRSTHLRSVSLAWRDVGSSTSSGLGVISTLPITGTLQTNIPANGPIIDRGDGEFEILLTVAEDTVRFEGATGLVQVPTDDFSALTKLDVALLIIGDEVFRVGFAEETSAGTVTIRTFLRGELGSLRAAHSVGALCAFWSEADASNLLPADGIPMTTAVEILGIPNTLGASPDPTVTVAPTGGGGIIFAGRSLRPFEPGLVVATRISNTWTIQIRPRMWVTGAGSRPNLQDDLEALVTTLEGLSLRFAKSTGGSTVTLVADQSFSTPPFAMPANLSIDSYAWIPDNGSAGSGLIEAVITFDSSPASLRIWAGHNGFESETFLAIPQPT